jgi:hypothetical protein
MPPTNPWGKKPPQQPKPSSSGFPELKPNKVKDDAAKPLPKPQYEETQEEELLVLESIYAEDFKRVEKNQGAWKV